jgi:UDP-N-acetylglucosamine 2-epimerase
MPEETNRVITDHISDLLLCPSQTAVSNLAAEGISRNVHLVGDVMLDVLNWATQQIDGQMAQTGIRLGLARKGYLLATVHRSENTDDRRQLRAIVEGLNALEESVVFPIHPRTRKALNHVDCSPRPHILFVDPVGYLEMIALTASARAVLTDSGGLQKEAYWLGVPCITLRSETEWVETVETGWNTLVGADSDRIVDAARSVWPPDRHPPLYGDGSASARCVDLIA